MRAGRIAQIRAWRLLVLGEVTETFRLRGLDTTQIPIPPEEMLTRGPENNPVLRSTARVPLQFWRNPGPRGHIHSSRFGSWSSPEVSTAG